LRRKSIFICWHLDFKVIIGFFLKKLSVILEHPVPTVVAGHGEDVQSWQAHTTLAGSTADRSYRKRSEMALGTLLLQKLY
jgi:hypothetical protein